jgi:hypothetical protein
MAAPHTPTDALAGVRARIEKMTFDETARWLRAVLWDTAVVPGVDWDEPPFAIVERVYEGLSGVARQVVLDAVMAALKSIAPAQPSTAALPADDNLLLLAADLFASSDDQLRNAAIDQFRRIGTGQYAYALQDRALGLLPTLRHRATPGFWKSIAAERPEERAALALRGLAGHDLSLACQWAAADPVRTKAFADLLPWLVEEHGVTAVSNALRIVWRRADANAKRDLRDWAHTLDLRLPSTSDPRERMAERLLSWQPGISPRTTITLLRTGLESSEGIEMELDHFVKQLALCFIDPERNQVLLASRALSELFSAIKDRLPGRYDDQDEVQAAIMQVDQRLNPPAPPVRAYVMLQ